MPRLLPCLADVGRARTELQKALELGVLMRSVALTSMYSRDFTLRHDLVAPPAATGSNYGDYVSR